MSDLQSPESPAPETFAVVPAESNAGSSAETVTCPTCGEVVLAAFGLRDRELVEVFDRSRMARTLIAGLLGLVAGISLLLFLYQATMRLPSGEHYRSTHLAWWQLLGHLVRGTVIGMVASTVWIMDRDIRGVRAGEPIEGRKFLEVLNQFWRVLAGAILAVGAYSVLTVPVYWLTASGRF